MIYDMNDKYAMIWMTSMIRYEMQVNEREWMMLWTCYCCVMLLGMCMWNILLEAIDDNMMNMMAMNISCKWMILHGDEGCYWWECWMIIQDMNCNGILLVFRNDESWNGYKWIAWTWAWD